MVLQPVDGENSMATVISIIFQAHGQWKLIKNRACDELGLGERGPIYYGHELGSVNSKEVTSAYELILAHQDLVLVSLA